MWWRTWRRTCEGKQQQQQQQRLSYRGGSDSHSNRLYQRRLTDAAIEIERSRRNGSRVSAADGAESELQVPLRAPFVLRSILTIHPRPQAMIDAMTGAAGERVLRAAPTILQYR